MAGAKTSRFNGTQPTAEFIFAEMDRLEALQRDPSKASPADREVLRRWNEINEESGRTTEWLEKSFKDQRRRTSDIDRGLIVY